MGRKVALNLCALLLGIILSLGLLEIALSIHNPVMQTVKGGKVVPPAYSDEIHRNSGIAGVAPEIHIHQNSLGFRGADPPADFADRLSLITVGGSTTRSAPQSDNNTWTALLGDAVADCFDRTWINDAGFDGHTSFAHIDLIRNYINQVHPKVVVMLIGANELYADSPNTQHREQIRLDPNFNNGIKGFFYALARRSEVVGLGSTLYRSFRAWKAGLNYGYNDWANLAEGDAMPSDGEANLAVAREMQPNYAARLHLILRLLRDEQTIPVLITQPTVGGIARDPTTGKELSRLRYGLFWYQSFEIYNDTMRHVAQSENVHLIDLARTMPKDTKYYLDTVHYTDAGAKKVAELVAGGLLPYLAQKFPFDNKGGCQNHAVNPG